MKKEILVTNKKYAETYGYNYEFKNDTLVLNASNYTSSEYWNLENCKPIKIHNTGNHLEVTIDGKKQNIEAGCLQDLFVALHIYMKHSNGWDVPEIYEIKKL